VDRFPGRVVSVVGNATLYGVGISTGDLFILSASGRRLFPCIGRCPLVLIDLAARGGLAERAVRSIHWSVIVALGGSIDGMECSPLKSPFLMVLLASGEVKIWNVGLRKLQLCDSIESIVTVRLAIFRVVLMLF
jgi:protein HIRA/HIR1